MLELGSPGDTEKQQNKDSNNENFKIESEVAVVSCVLNFNNQISLLVFVKSLNKLTFCVLILQWILQEI